jgi:hypothetical protein
MADDQYILVPAWEPPLPSQFEDLVQPGTLFTTASLQDKKVTPMTPQEDVKRIKESMSPLNSAMHLALNTLRDQFDLRKCTFHISNIKQAIPELHLRLFPDDDSSSGIFGNDFIRNKPLTTHQPLHSYLGRRGRMALSRLGNDFHGPLAATFTAEIAESNRTSSPSGFENVHYDWIVVQYLFYRGFQ